MAIFAKLTGVSRRGARSKLDALLYVALISPAILLAIGGSHAQAGQLAASAFQAYDPSNAGSIVAGPFSLYSVSVSNIAPTQMNEGLTEVGKKASGFDLLLSSQLSPNLLTDIEPVVVGPGGKLYLLDGHHTFTALLDSIYGSSNPTVYVNVVANYSNLTTQQFFSMLQSQNLLLPLNDGVPETINTATGAPIPSSLTGLTSDVYRGLEYSILKNKSSKLFTTSSNITGAVGSAIPGLDKMTGFYSDFFEAAAYRNANGGLGLPFLSPGDIAVATAWNLNPNSQTSLPNVSGAVSAAQLPGFILNKNIVNSGGITNATLANGAIDGFGTFTGVTQINAGTASNPIFIGTPNVGFVMQLGNDKGFTVTLNGANSYTGGTSILAGDLVIQSDASLGATPLSNADFTSSLNLNASGVPTNVKAAVQAANGIVFNSLDEGNGTLTVGTSTGGSFSTSRPIAVGGETATINLNGNTVRLNGQLISLGVDSIGIGNATGFSDLTIDDASSNTGKLILSTPSPYFYGNIIIGNTNKPTVEVMNDAAMGNTSGPAYAIGQVVLNGGTFQAGASFNSVRGFSIQSKSTFDTNSFATSFAGALSDSQRNLTITNTGTGAGAVSFGSFDIGSALELTVSKGTGTSTSVTFTNGIQQTSSSDQLLLKPNSGSFGTSEKVFTGSGSTPALKNGIVAPWIVIDSGASNNPYDFATYSSGAGFTAFSAYATSITSATSSSVVKQAANASLTADTQAYALNIQKGDNVTVTGHTLTLGDGQTAGLILNGGSGSGLTGGTLAFGTAAAYVTINGSSTISSQIAGSGGLNLAGTGTLTVSAASTETGLVTVNSGTLSLTTANVFSGAQGLLLQDTKNLATANLTISANNQLAALNSAGNNSTITISGGAVLTIGDSHNLSSTISSTITDSTATAGAITKDGTGLLDLSGATITLAAGSSIVANGGQLRVATGALKNTAVAGSAPNFTLANGADLQFAQSGGGQYAGTISGNGTLHLIGGTLQLLGTSNSYAGGTIVETGSTLDITTANLPAINPNITNAGGTVLFDQATNGTYSGVISDGYEMGVGPLLSGTLIKDDSTGANGGNVTITQKQAFTGPTFIEAGTLTLNAVDTLAASSGVDLGRVGGGATASLVLGADNTIQALTNEAGNTTSVQMGGFTLTINPSANIFASYSGSINGTGALVKMGDGAQAFSGPVTVGSTTVNGGILDIASGGSLTTGTTTINGGILETDSGSSYTSSNINIGSGSGFYALGGSLSLANSTINNAGTVNLNNGTGTNVLTLGTYNGAAGSQLQLGVNFNANTADRLVVNSVSGSSQLVIADVAPNKPGVYNPTGIPIVVSANPLNPSAFTLAGGPIQKGLFQYDLAYNPDPEFMLVGVPTADAYRFATMPTAAQQIWFDTVGVWQDRQADLRDLISAGGIHVAATPAVGQGTYAEPVSPALWARVVGNWADRTQTQSYSLFGNSYTFNTSYTQDTGGFFGGLDGVRQNLLSEGDTLTFGITGGYIGSKQNFQGSTTTAAYQGGSVGVQATYYNRNFFVDAVMKADFLGLTYSAPVLASFGTSVSTSSVQNYGGFVDGGYRFAISDKSFIEPLLGLGYVTTRIGSLSIGGSQVSFGNNDNLRGRFGVRGGTALVQTQDYRIDGTVTASYWNRLSGGAAATINSGVGSPLLNIADTQVTSYGEIGLGLNVFSLKTGWSGFLKTDFQASSNFTDGSVKGGVRLDF